jgi:hypothetical protein
LPHHAHAVRPRPRQRTSDERSVEARHGIAKGGQGAVTSTAHSCQLRVHPPAPDKEDNRHGNQDQSTCDGACRVLRRDVRGVEQRESRDGSPYWRWSFSVRTPEGYKAVSGVSSTNSGPKAKAYRWLTGILGHAPASDERLDTGTLAGNRCLVVLEENTDGFSNVTDVLPPPRLSEATIQSYVDDADRNDGLPF